MRVVVQSGKIKMKLWLCHSLVQLHVKQQRKPGMLSFASFPTYNLCVESVQIVAER
jgi:hypothetical protein